MNKEKKTEVEKVIQTDENLNEVINKEITSNTSETDGDIPDFTSGDSDSGEDDTSE